MADLLGNDIGLNYKGLLNLFTTINTGLDATLRVVTDGEGDSSPLYLSQTAIGLGTTSIWDNTNGRLGIGTNSPANQLSTYVNVVAGSSSPTGVAIENASSTGYVNLSFKNNAGTAQFFYSGNARGSTLNNLFSFYNPSTAGYAFDQKVSIGTSVIATGGMLEVTAASSTVGLYVKGAASTDIQRWYDSSNTLQTTIDSAGSIMFSSGCGLKNNNGVGVDIGHNYSSGGSGWQVGFTDGGSGASRYGYIANSGSVFSTSTTPSTIQAVAIFELQSTTKGFIPPKMTTTQKNAITAVEGLVVFDTTLHTLTYYNGTIWV